METSDTIQQRPTCSNSDANLTPNGNVSKDKLNEDHVGMEKNIGVPSAIAKIVGTIIGSGIFMSPQVIASHVGSAGLSLIIWALCGVVASIAGLSYVELGTLVKQSGGEYAYLNAAYGKKLGTVLAFLYSWACFTILKPTTLAIITLICAQYTTNLFFSDTNICGSAESVIIKLTAVTIILLLCFINCYSVKLASNIQVIFTVAKLLALVLIMIGGFVRLGQGYTEVLEHGFEGTTAAAGPVAFAFYNGMWAYDGWNSLNLVTEEMRNPNKHLPLAIIIALPMVTVVYVLTNISYFTVMSVDELLASPGVATTWAESVIPNAVWIIPVSVVMSTFGSGNGTLFGSARIHFVAARDGNTLAALSYIQVKRQTPVVSLVAMSIIAIMYAVTTHVGTLLHLFSFTKWIFYGLTFNAVIIMRFTEPYKSMYRPFKVPLALPIIALALAVYLVLVPLITNPQIEFLYALIFVVAGLILYVPFVYFGWVLPGTDWVTMFLQQLLQAVPPPEFDAFEYENEEVIESVKDAIEDE